MKFHSIICSRSSNPPKEIESLQLYYREANIDLMVMLDQNSIFEGYNKGFESLYLEDKDEDIIILCHDDIEIITDRNSLKSILYHSLNDTKNVGFVGVAGTTYLDKDATWWKLENRQKGLHRGFVFQGPNIKTMVPNYFGPFDNNVVCLDGCFLAAKAKTLRNIGLSKPKWLTNNWDFYDIIYTVESYNRGYFNKTTPVIIRHLSNGEMRKEWYESNNEFKRHYRLPISCR